MDYLLAKELKNADYPFKQWQVDEGMDRIDWEDTDIEVSAVPTLEELIEACGETFSFLAKADDGSEWKATAYKYHGHKLTEVNASTPTEAVARLWLALNKNATA